MQTQLKRFDDPSIIDSFRALYTRFHRDSIHNMPSIYSKDIVFIDPVHTIRGLNNLSDYFNGICENLSECHFTFLDEIVVADSAFFKWEMSYRHQSIKSNAQLNILGATYIKYSDKIDVHQDFYDMGAMLYEHLPLLGNAIKMIKSRVANN